MYSNKKRQAILLALLAAHCTFYGTNVMAAPVPVTDGKYTAQMAQTLMILSHIPILSTVSKFLMALRFLSPPVQQPSTV